MVQQNNHQEAIKLLCEAKIDPNVKIFPGISPFKLACGCGYVPCIQEMMRCFPSATWVSMFIPADSLGVVLGGFRNGAFVKVFKAKCSGCLMLGLRCSQTHSIPPETIIGPIKEFKDNAVHKSFVS